MSFPGMTHYRSFKSCWRAGPVALFSHEQRSAYFSMKLNVSICTMINRRLIFDSPALDGDIMSSIRLSSGSARHAYLLLDEIFVNIYIVRRRVGAIAPKLK